MTEEELLDVGIEKAKQYYGYNNVFLSIEESAYAKGYTQGHKDCEEEHKDDTDLATIAYMQGADRARPKWHNVTDWTKQEQFPDSEGFLYVIECKESYYHLCEYEITEGYGQFHTFPDGEDIDPEDVVRWIEIKAN